MRPKNRHDVTHPRRSRYFRVAQVRHVGIYTCRGCATYRVQVASSGEKDPWTEYLESLLARPDWNVKRLAEASGIHRATIYRWLRGDIKNITIESVRMIAKGGEGSLAAALTAARSHTMHEPVDTADEDDYEVRIIRESDLSESVKRNLYAHLARRRAQLREEIEALVRTNEPEHEMT